MQETQGIRLEGAPNFRDLGGTKTSAGHRVRFGQLFRSGDSRALTEKDISKLTALDIKLVVDLRSIHESIGADMRWPLAPGVEVIQADILADMRAGDKSIMNILVDQPDAEGSHALMVNTYARLPQALRKVLGQLATRLAHERKVPLVFHCTYGRDRSGFVAAMLLHALGVGKEDIRANYLATNDHIDATAMRRLVNLQLQPYKVVLDDQALHNLTHARDENFDAAYASMEAEFGTVDNYLLACGFDAHVTQTLRQHLLEPA